MSGHGHWNKGTPTNEMVAWNNISRLLIGGETPVISQNLILLAEKNADSLVEELKEEGLDSYEILEEAKSSDYIENIERSKTVLLRLCEGGLNDDGEVVDNTKRKAVSELISQVKDVYLKKIETSLDSSFKI